MFSAGGDLPVVGSADSHGPGRASVNEMLGRKVVDGESCG
jgi:hypothetical protein